MDPKPAPGGPRPELLQWHAAARTRGGITSLESRIAMSHTIAVHYDEIGLKGKNRPRFEQALRRAIATALAAAGRPAARIRSFFGRVLVELDAEDAWPAARQALPHVFGIAHFARVWRTPADLDAIAEHALRLLPEEPSLTFAVRARRADKVFPLPSPEINRQLGDRILAVRPWRVDLTSPDLALWVVFIGRHAFLSCERIDGPGGLPAGSSGKVVCLLSAGIDSPVAAHRLMRRGALPVFVHFHSYPFTGASSQDTARRLAEVLLAYQAPRPLWLVPLGPVQEQIVADCTPALRVLLYRRFMFRIAERIAARERAGALVTGESLGQVASQTLENMAAVSSAVSLPVFRPLIGMDKRDITAEARAIGSFALSACSSDDCCSYLVPAHPATRASAAQLARAETDLSVDALMDAALAAAERRVITGPASAP